MKLLLNAMLLSAIASQAHAAREFQSEELGLEKGRRVITELTVPSVDSRESAGQGAGPLDARAYSLNPFDRATENKLLAILNQIPEVAATGNVGALYGVVQSQLPHNALLENPALLEKTRAALTAMATNATAVRISVLNVETFHQSGFYENENLVEQDRCIGGGGSVVELLFTGPAGTVPFYFSNLGKMLNQARFFEIEQPICQSLRNDALNRGYTFTRIP